MGPAVQPCSRLGTKSESILAMIALLVGEESDHGKIVVERQLTADPTDFR